MIDQGRESSEHKNILMNGCITHAKLKNPHSHLHSEKTILLMEELCEHILLCGFFVLYGSDRCELLDVNT